MDLTLKARNRLNTRKRDRGLVANILQKSHITRRVWLTR